MANNDNDRPGRVKPNESENQPGYQPEDEAQRDAQEDTGDPSRRRGFDEGRKDEVSSPSPGGVDPKRGDSGEEQVERKSAPQRGDKPSRKA
jgi:hypothetical protein